MADNIKTWVELNLKLLEQARALINATAEPSNIWRGAELEAQLAPMADDVIAGGGATKAQIMGISGMWGGFKYWIGTPMAAFGALFGLVPLIADYGAAMAALAAVADGTDAAAIDTAQATLDAASTALLEHAGTVAQAFAAGGATPFNVIFGDL